MNAMFMVTTNWRGALHIDPMRIWPTLEEAAHYGKGLAGGTLRIYLLSASSAPVLVNPKDYEQWM